MYDAKVLLFSLLFPIRWFKESDWEENINHDKKERRHCCAFQTATAVRRGTVFGSYYLKQSCQNSIYCAVCSGDTSGCPVLREILSFRAEEQLLRSFDLLNSHGLMLS